MVWERLKIVRGDTSALPLHPRTVLLYLTYHALLTGNFTRGSHKLTALCIGKNQNVWLDFTVGEPILSPASSDRKPVQNDSISPGQINN